MNKDLRRINLNDFPAIYSLMQKSFAPIEVRPYGMQRDLLKRPNYKILVSLDENKSIQGFITEWTFDEFYFLEHFAVQPELRGGGIGSQIMQSYLQSSEKPIIIEVEADESEISLRRINFYRRLGFHLNEFGYYQPFMQHIPGNMIYLKIMSYPFATPLPDLQRFKNNIFRNVYGL